MLFNIALVAGGLVCLFYGGAWLVRGASNLALSFGVSVLVIALTVVAIGTSTPELLVSLQAALAGKSDLAIGNVIGSNIANIGLILGATGLVSPLTVKAVLLRREIPIMIVFSVVAFALALDGEISRVDGALLLIAFIGFNALVYRVAKREINERDSLSASVDEKPRRGRGRNLALLLLGILALVFGARLMVEGAVNLARLVGISELVIAITLVALGTSLPELAASLSAAYQGQTDLAIGNVVGSNIANLLMILGVTAIAQPIAVRSADAQFEFLVMFAFAILLIPFLRNQTLSRSQSALFLGAYIAFVVYSVATGGVAPAPA